MTIDIADEIPDCESVGRDHEWEAVEYDPTVGLIGQRTCVVCGAWRDGDFAEDDYSFAEDYLDGCF